MSILAFTEGTIIMHRGAVGHTHDEIVRQVEERNFLELFLRMIKTKSRGCFNSGTRRLEL